jgi:hypothetical protein
MGFSFSCLSHTVQKPHHSFSVTHNLENVWRV